MFGNADKDFYVWPKFFFFIKKSFSIMAKVGNLVQNKIDPMVTNG
jgi:hypothetical protein